VSGSEANLSSSSDAYSTVQASYALLRLIMSPPYTDRLSRKSAGLQDRAPVPRLNACLWGGIYNPIIPVFERAPIRWQRFNVHPKGLDIARGYMRFFEPDVVVETAPGLAKKIGWQAGERLIETQRFVSLDEFITLDTTGRVNFASGVDITAVHGFLYNKEFKYQRKREEKFVLIRNAPKRDAFYEAVVGSFPGDANLAYIEGRYREAFRPTELDHSPETFLSLMEEPAYTPLAFTRHGLEEDYARRSDLRFFVFDPTDAQDVIDFWNLRQFDRDVTSIHIAWFDSCVPMMREHIEKTHRPIPGNPFGTKFQTDVEFARSITEERARCFVESHLRELPQASVGFQLFYENIWHDGDYRLIFRPERVRLTAETAAIDEEVSEQRLRAVVPTPVPEFLKDGHWYRRATWVNVIQAGRSFADDSELATVYRPIAHTKPVERTGVKGSHDPIADLRARCSAWTRGCCWAPSVIGRACNGPRLFCDLN
jgi:hypothetical protein